MRLAFLLWLLPAIALAQPVATNCSSPSVACRASKFTLLTGNKLCLNGTGCTASISSSTSPASAITLMSGVANSGTNFAFTMDSTVALTGTMLLLRMRSGGGTDVIEIDRSGTIFGSGFFSLSTGTTQGVFFSGSNTLIRGSGGAALVALGDTTGANYMTCSATQCTTLAAGNPIPVVHAAQTANAVATEFGSAAATGGVLAVSFSTAFASAPKCQCTGENATATGCVISTVATTAGVSFKFNAGTDVIDWYCIGAK